MNILSTISRESPRWGTAARITSASDLLTQQLNILDYLSGVTNFAVIGALLSGASAQPPSRHKITVKLGKLSHLMPLQSSIFLFLN